MSARAEAVAAVAAAPSPGRVGLRDIVAMAVFALRGNVLRSVLTALGVIIGIAAVIVMVSVAQGTQAELDRTIANLGSNRIEVWPGSGRGGGVRLGTGTVSSLDDGDVAAIRSEIGGVQHVAGQIRGMTQAVNAERNWNTQWVGVMPDYFPTNGWEVATGAGFAPRDYGGAAKVVLIGTSLRDRLFQGEDPIGRPIRLGRVPFTVVGVLKSKGQSGWGGDMDDVAMVPLETARRRLAGQMNLPPGAVTSISVGTARAQDLPRVEREVGDLLRQRHKIPRTTSRCATSPRSCPRAARPRV